MLKSRSLLFPMLLFCCQPLLAAKRTNEVQWTYESYLFGEQQKLAESSVNPGNAVFAQPQQTLTLDNRIEMKWLINDAKVIARPRWIFTQDQVKNEMSGEEKSTTLGRVDMMDAFVEQTVNRKLSTTVGLQVYQWGPGELFNVSNPFFRFNNRQQTFTYKEKGHALVRFNYSFDLEKSLVLIGEPVSNREAFWMSEKEFKPQAALKFERTWKNTRNYYGLLAGSEAQQNPFVGEYAQYEFKPGFTIYVDAKHSYELAHYAPKANALGVYDMELVGENEQLWSHMALAGFRYEGNVDFRIEFLHNSAGYTKTEFENATLSASNFFNPKFPQNVTRYVFSGLNFPTQNYLYLSLRIMEPGSWRDFNFYLRTLNSLTDESGLVQAEFDKGLGNSFVVYASYTYFMGRQNTEFRLLDDWKALVGLKYSL
jgi:hypothetical protein